MFNFKKPSYQRSKKNIPSDLVLPCPEESNSMPLPVQPCSGPKGSITFQLVNGQEVFITGPLQMFDSDLKKMLKLNGAHYNPGDEDSLVQNKKGWVISQDKMGMLIGNVENNCPQTNLRKVPSFVYKALMKLGDSLYYLDQNRVPIEIEYPSSAVDVATLLDPKILSRLYEF